MVARTSSTLCTSSRLFWLSNFQPIHNMKKHRVSARCFFVFGMAGLLAIVFAWRTYLFAYFYLSSLLFLLDIAFDTHAIREVYYLHKKNDRVKTLSLAMPQLVGVPGFEPGTLCSQSRCANRTALHPESFCECKGRQKNGFCKLFDKKKLKYCPIISSYGNKTRKSDELCEFCYTFVYIIYSKII